MALSVEASELLEIFQWQKAEEYKRANDEQKEMIRDEIADIFYYIVRISDKLDKASCNFLMYSSLSKINSGVS